MKFINFLLYIISFVFRLFIYIISILCINNHQNLFPVDLYLLAGVLHFGVFIVAKSQKEKYMPQVRLLNDYAFITFVLFQKELNDVLNYSLFILPIINSSNYTGKYTVKASVVLYVAAIISGLCINYKEFTFLQAIPLFVFFVINALTKYREHQNQFELELADSISDYNELAVYSSKRKVLSEIKEKVNHDRVFNEIGFYKINSILCFQVSKEKIHLLCSSELNIDYHFDRITSASIRNHSDGNPTGISIVIAGSKIDKQNIIAIMTAVDNKKYLFLTIFQVNVSDNSMLNRLLTSVFNKFTRTLDVEGEITARSRKLRAEINEKASFIYNAVNNTHFINNQLGPIKTHLEILRIMRSTKDPHMHQKLRDKAYDEENKANNSLRVIVQRNTKLLEKANNPLTSEVVQNIKIEDIIQIIIDNWVELLSDNNVKSNIAINDVSRIVSINVYAFETLLDEIENNMQKHGADVASCACTINLDGNVLIIYFMNRIKANRLEDVKGVVRRFNDEKGMEKSETHGLSVISNSCKKLLTKPMLSIEGDTFLITIKLSVNP